jgi:hypothetical protein
LLAKNSKAPRFVRRPAPSSKLADLTLVAEEIDIFVLIPPTAAPLANMRLEGKARHFLKTPVISRLNVEPLVTLFADAVTDVASEIEVLETLGCDQVIGERVEIVERGFRPGECAHHRVQQVLDFITPC